MSSRNVVTAVYVAHHKRAGDASRVSDEFALVAGRGSCKQAGDASRKSDKSALVAGRESCKRAGDASPRVAPLAKPSAPRDQRCRIPQTNLSGSQSQSLWQFAAWPGTYHRPKRMPVIDHGQRPWFHAVIISDGPFYSPRIVPPPLHYTQPFRSIVFLNPAGPKGPDRCLPWVATPLFVLSLRP